MWRYLFAPDLPLKATPPRLYVAGATHLYLGRQYRLKLADDPRDAVRLARGYLHISTPDRVDTARVKRLLDDWYQARATRVFHDLALPRLQKVSAEDAFAAEAQGEVVTARQNEHLLSPDVDVVRI